MKKKMMLFHIRFLSDEAGMALLIVLILLLLGSLTMLPVLAQLSTALKTGDLYEEKTNALYTADAGIEDALWRLKYDSLGPTYSEYDFNTVWDYETELLNGMVANATIQNVWIPTNVTLSSLGLNADSAEVILESEKLVVTGSSGAIPGEPYIIKIDFTPAISDNLTVKSIGVWLPQGFEFISGNNTLEAHIGQPYHPDSVSKTDCPGGTATVWSYNTPYPEFTTFPVVDTEAITLSTEIKFCYNPPPGRPNDLPTAIAWITTNMESGVNDVPISWDRDTRIFHITSEAGDTSIDAYSSKCELRQLGDAIAGDYVAIGSSLMTNVINNKRYTLESDSTHVLTSIPDDADAIAAYLYWSAWRDSGIQTDILSDTCTNFDYWTRSADSVTQTRVPTADGDNDGTWNSAPRWDDVDETSANDSDYMTGTTNGGGYQLFTSDNFSIPGGSEIKALNVYIRVKSTDWGTNNIRPTIKVNGTLYNTVADSNNPGTGWTTYYYSYITNPDTGAAWEVNDINGTGDNPLEQFGVYTTDLSPDIRVSMVYAEVVCGYWSIYNNDDFQGQGSGTATTEQRTLTLTDSLDLSSYEEGTVVVSWAQTESGYLESDDALYFAISSDNGTSWSDNIEAFSDDDPDALYWYNIPEDYMTSGFKLRFYSNFDSDAEFVYLDNIRVSYLPPDMDAVFQIDGEQVYINDSGIAVAGSENITADNWQVMPSPFSGDFDGFSYSCSLDVSKLVKAFPENEGEEYHTGNAAYTMGGVEGSTGHHLSYAGWSLIIVYSSPETAGHYLYLSDTFAFHPGTGDNLDFDFDGEPGGDITNFIIPEPIKDQYGNIIEEVAANITCFIGEGDAVWTPEYVQITGQQSANSMYLSNSVSPWNNVWNGESPGMTYSGVDIDSFEILWTDQIFQPGDTSVHLDMVSNQDAHNFIYFIISVRSETVTGGTSHYVIYNG